MDDYPAAEPVPDMSRVNFQYTEIVSFLRDNDEMRKTARNALKQGLIAGASTVGGALLFGPIGGLIGGIAGSILGFQQADEYDGVITHVMKLEGRSRIRLVDSIRVALTAAGASLKHFESPEIFRTALTEFVSKEQVREKVWHACVDAIKDDEKEAETK